MANKPYKRDYSEEEKELEELENSQTPGENEGENPSGEPQAQTPPSENPEEQTFKKRYGDLRRFTQGIQDENKSLKTRIENLEQQLETTTKQQIEFPDVSSKEEAEAWIKKYPDLAKIFRYLALEQDSKIKEDFTKTQSELEKIKFERDRTEAFTTLHRLQPDFQEILASEEFQNWLVSKSQRMQDAIYKHIDPHDASDVIDVYKVQVLGKKEKPKKDEANEKRNRRAAENIRSTSGSPPQNSGNDEVWTESYIEEMSRKNKNWFEQNEEKIMQMAREGRLEMDLTGAAR